MNHQSKPRTNQPLSLCTKNLKNMSRTCSTMAGSGSPLQPIHFQWHVSEKRSEFPSVCGFQGLTSQNCPQSPRSSVHPIFVWLTWWSFMVLKTQPGLCWRELQTPESFQHTLRAVQVGLPPIWPYQCPSSFSKVHEGGPWQTKGWMLLPILGQHTLLFKNLSWPCW